MPAPITRTQVVDCNCDPPGPHGRYHNYNVHKCGCDPCRRSYGKYKKALALNVSRGHRQIVDAKPTRDYLHLLHSRGMTYVEVGRITGLHRFAIHRIVKHKVNGISRKNEALIRSIPLPSVDIYEAREMKNSRVPVGETKDIILNWRLEGATYRAIAEATGLTTGTLHKIATNPEARIYQSTRTRIAEAFTIAQKLMSDE